MYVIRRSTHNPLISPNIAAQWEARGTFNPCVVRRGNLTHMLYRALGRPDALMTPAGISTIGKALTVDGHHFQNRRQFIVPDEPWEKYGCEDPRATYFEGSYVIFYTALGGQPFGPGNIKIACAISKDLETIDEKHLVTPFNGKAMALFPERVDGKITAILTAHTDEPPAHIAIAQCDQLSELWDLSFWEKWHANLSEHSINPLRFDHDHVEVGAPPVKTKEGWLLFYSYIQNYFGGGERVYGIEAVLSDLLSAMIPERRTGLAPRAKGNPILKPVPEHAWEGKAVFNPGAIDIDGTVHLLYRAMGEDNTSVLGYAASKNGIRITQRSTSPVYVPREDFEQKKGPPGASSGCEDPRLTRIGGTIHLVYTAFDGVSPLRAALSSISVKDFVAQKFDTW